MQAESTLSARVAAVFSRPPVPGAVKTRLTPGLPPELACELHRAMLLDTLAAVRACGADRRLLLWADEPSPDARSEVAGFEQELQHEGHLGARLEHAFTTLLVPGGRVVIVGTDAPEIEPDLLDQAFDALAAHDAALGPTADGGFYLIGLRGPPGDLLEGVPWGTSDARGRTLERLTSRGATVHALAPLSDIDTCADLVALLVRLLERPDRAPAHTRQALAAMGLLV